MASACAPPPGRVIRSHAARQLSGEAAAPSGKLFAVFPPAAIPAPGLTPPEGQETSQSCTHYQADQIPHFRPPQAAAGGRRSSRGRRAQVPCRRRSPTGYCPVYFYSMTILPVNVSWVNIQLILINAGLNGLRPSAIPEENHFPKPGVCGILRDRKSCNLTGRCY